MKKNIFIVLLISIIIMIFGCSNKKYNLKGFYQTEINGYHIQMLIQEKNNTFIEWIDNREVDKGTYKKTDDDSYLIMSERQNFKIELNDDNSFEIIINKLNGENPIIMKNVTTDDTTTTFGKWYDVKEYESLLD